LPIVQNAACIYQDIAMIVDHLVTLQVFDLHIISAPLLVPDCASDLVLRFDVFA